MTYGPPLPIWNNLMVPPHLWMVPPHVQYDVNDSCGPPYLYGIGI